MMIKRLCYHAASWDVVTCSLPLHCQCHSTSQGQMSCDILLDPTNTIPQSIHEPHKWWGTGLPMTWNWNRNRIECTLKCPSPICETLGLLWCSPWLVFLFIKCPLIHLDNRWFACPDGHNAQVEAQKAILHNGWPDPQWIHDQHCNHCCISHVHVIESTFYNRTQFHCNGWWCPVISHLHFAILPKLLQQHHDRICHPNINLWVCLNVVFNMSENCGQFKCILPLV